MNANLTVVRVVRATVSRNMCLTLLLVFAADLPRLTQAAQSTPDQPPAGAVDQPDRQPSPNQPARTRGSSRRPDFANPAPPEQPPANPPQAQPQPQPQAPRPPRPARPARLETEVIRIVAPSAKAADVDVPALNAKAAKLADLLKLLGEVGTATVDFRADQGIDLFSETRLDIAADVPYTSSISKTADGTKTTRGFSREKVGARLDLAPLPTTDSGPPLIRVNLECSFMTRGVTDNDGVAPPVFHRLLQMHVGAAEMNKPILLLATDGGHEEGDDKIMIVVTRLVFREP